MSIICPLVIAWPVSAYMFRQGQRLKQAHRELARAHAQLAAAHRRLSEKACRDVMTGMLNRESFFAALDGSRLKSDCGALLLMDADHFKSINFIYRHLVGDQALLLIATDIRRGIRCGYVVDIICSEEFGSFFVGANEVEERLVVERIRLKVVAIRFRP